MSPSSWTTRHAGVEVVERMMPGTAHEVTAPLPSKSVQNKFDKVCLLIKPSLACAPCISPQVLSALRLKPAVTDGKTCFEASGFGLCCREHRRLQ